MFLVSLAAIALFTYPAWVLLHPHFAFPFHRLGERIGMLALLALFLLFARRLGIRDRTSLGFGLSRGAFAREAVVGLALGAIQMSLAVGGMAALGLLGWAQVGANAVSVARVVVMSLLAGITVAMIEETFLRGAMFSAIERESGVAKAVVLTAVVYAASHFFASFHITPEHVSSRSGIDLLVGTLATFLHPIAIADAFLSLFAVGVVLGIVRAITGNIAACIGLHAGWVWIMLLAHALSQPERTVPLGFLLSQFDGFVGWLVLGWTILLGLGLRHFYRQRVRRQGAAAR